jgi:hypothetical protein
LRTFAARVSLRQAGPSLAFHPDTPRCCLSTPPLTPFNATPTSLRRVDSRHSGGLCRSTRRRRADARVDEHGARDARDAPRGRAPGVGVPRVGARRRRGRDRGGAGVHVRDVRRRASAARAVDFAVWTRRGRGRGRDPRSRRRRGFDPRRRRRGREGRRRVPRVRRRVQTSRGRHQSLEDAQARPIRRSPYDRGGGARADP